ncbi:hypothetical protein AMTRI_Chr05g69130 [Amborella trichopoda]
MWQSISLTLAATAGNNIGKVLQKKGTLILPPLSFKLKVLRAYAINKAWVTGLLIDIIGALLMLRALSQAPVSVGIGGEEQSGSTISFIHLLWLVSIVAILFTRGLKHGRAIVVSTCAAVASILTGVLAGMLALGEQLPAAPLARLFVLLGWLLIMAGVILLVSSQKLLFLAPRPLRQFLHGGSERNFGIRRSNSVRLRDPSPTTLVSISPLHHLKASPAKAKT